MDISQKDARIVLRESGNQRFTGVFIAILGLLFIAPEILLWYAEGRLSYFLGGFGAALVATGVVLARRAGAHSHIDLHNRLMHIDGADYDLGVEVACVVLTERIATVQSRGSSSKLRLYQIFAILADDDRPVVQKARQLGESDVEHGIDGADGTTALPDQVPDGLRPGGKFALRELLDSGANGIVLVGESTQNREAELSSVGKTVARYANAPLVDVQDNAIEVLEAEDSELPLVWRLARRTDLEDPGPPPANMQLKSDSGCREVCWRHGHPTVLLGAAVVIIAVSSVLGWAVTAAPLLAVAMGVVGVTIPFGFYLAGNRPIGNIRLEYDGHRLRCRSSGPWGIDEQIPVDDVTHIRQSTRKSAYDNCELSILSAGEDQLRLRMSEDQATWLEAKLHFWLGDHAVTPEVSECNKERLPSPRQSAH